MYITSRQSDLFFMFTFEILYIQKITTAIEINRVFYRDLSRGNIKDARGALFISFFRNILLLYDLVDNQTLVIVCNAYPLLPTACRFLLNYSLF